jgi:glycosyltransferase involved in cell wall biosynthesis
MAKYKDNQSKSPATQILFVNIEGKIAGAEQSLLLLTRHLTRDFHITAACPVPSPLAQVFSHLQTNTFGILAPPRRTNWLIWAIYFVTVNLQIVLIIFRTKPALMYANTSKAMLASMFAAILTRKKMIWHVRDLPHFNLVSKICGFFGNRVIAVSNTVKDMLIGHGIKPTIIKVVYNGVQIENSLAANKTNCSKPIRFANIGQLVPWKKQDVFIEAAVCFIRDGGNAEFILVGDDIFGRDALYKAKLVNKIEASGMGDKITFMGWHADMETLWSQIDCLVHTADSEPFGRVIIEAMAHKVPVIAADSGGPAEIIQDGVTGLLVKTGDIGELAQAMKRIAIDSNFARTLIDTAFNHVVTNFSAEKTAQGVKAIYQEVLAE